MPQPVLASPKAPEAASGQHPQRERELRVQADAGVFSMLLGALQAGEPGIVVGEARDDSAAEWSAARAREDRQNPRDNAQSSAVRAQEPRDPLARLSASAEAPRSVPSPVAQWRADAVEAPGRSDGPSRPAAQHTSAAPAGPAKALSQPAAAWSTATAAVSTPASFATTATASTAAPSGASSAPSQPSAVAAAAAHRGPQGGAARGKPHVPTPTPNERNLRFERVFEAQVGRGLAKALQNGEGSVTLRLKPQHLGQLNVRVDVRESQVTATFEARTAEAQRLLEGSRDALRQQLESRGLTVERIDVRLIEEPQAVGTRVAFTHDGGADGGQDGQGLAQDRNGRGSPDAGAQDGSRGGAPREDDEAGAGAEPWRALGTMRLDAIA